MTRAEAVALPVGSTVWALDNQKRRRYYRLVDLGTVDYAIVETGGQLFPAEQIEIRIDQITEYVKAVAVTGKKAKRGRA